MTSTTSHEFGRLPEDDFGFSAEVRFRTVTQQIKKGQAMAEQESDQRKKDKVLESNKRILKVALGVAAVASVVVLGGAYKIKEAYDNSPVNPNVVAYPYTVPATEGYPMVSAISDDLHAIAPNQQQDEENQLVETYLPKADQVRSAVRVGETFTFFINTQTGKLIPNPNQGTSSGETG